MFDYNAVMDRVSNCGTEKIEIVGPSAEIIDIVKYCDNRICDNPGCIVHRQYKYKKVHFGQINILNDSMVNPKSWVFTGWVLPYPIDKSFCRKKLRYLYKILSNKKFGSRSHFSIHMEIALRKNNYYLHFHVVSDGIIDLRFCQKKWNRWVTYQYAIKKENLAEYISKYASKTPRFYNEYQRFLWFQYVYKTQTVRYSCRSSQKINSGYYTLDFLRWDIYNTKKKSSNLDSYDLWLENFSNEKFKNGFKPPPQQKLNFLN